MKDFDELKAADREFKVAGETFHWRDVRPEVLTSFTAEPNGNEPNSAWKLIDQQITLFLPEDERAKWEELRARDEEPVTIQQMEAILMWLTEQQTGRPTETPSPSAPGRGRTAATSKDK